MEKVKAIMKIESHALKKDITVQQYRVLIGLVNSGDIDGAIKGLNKILRKAAKRTQSVREGKK